MELIENYLLLLTELSQSGTFWVGVSFAGLLGLLLYYKMPKLILSQLDEQRNTIARELEEAANLYAKAEKLLNEHQSKLNQLKTEQESILETAKKQVADYKTERQKAWEEKLKQLEKQAETRIESAKTQALAELHRQTAKLALAASKKIIQQKADSNQIINQSIAEIEIALSKAKQH